MTEPSQYFKGRTVQEQMNEVIGYVDVRAEEVAAAKADDVLEPAEQAKDDAVAAKEAAEQARDTTLAALPQVQSDIDALEGRMDTVELKVMTAEGNIVTIQGQITALQTADSQNVKINNINQYAVGLTGNQANIGGNKTFLNPITINAADGLSFNKNVSNFDHSSTPPNNTIMRLIQLNDNQGRYIFRLNVVCYTDGRTALQCEGYVIDSGGNRVYKSAVITTLSP